MVALLRLVAVPDAALYGTVTLLRLVTVPDAALYGTVALLVRLLVGVVVGDRTRISKFRTWIRQDLCNIITPFSYCCPREGPGLSR